MDSEEIKFAPVLTCTGADEVLGATTEPCRLHRYYTRDPVSNLAIKVTLTKVREVENREADPLADGDGSASPAPQSRGPTTPIPTKKIKPHVQQFSWQQKEFGRVQLNDLRNKEPHEVESMLEKSYMEKIRQEDEERSKREEELREGTKIFSTVDCEGTQNLFAPKGKMADGADVPDFMDKVSNLTQKEDKRELRKWEKFETMVLMAEIMNPSDTGPEQRSYHQPLLFVKYTKGGELEIQPDFTNKETTFYHSFESLYGDMWRYEVENVKEVPKKKLNMLRMQQQDAERFRLERFRNQVGDEFTNMPLWDEINANIFAEVVSAERFTAEKLYVELFVGLPTGWTPRPGSDAYITQHEVSTQFSRCNAHNSNEAKWHFGFPFELELHRTRGASMIRWPRIYMCVSSVDSWQRHRAEGYGYVDVPCFPGMHDLRVHTWRPQGTIRERMMDFYLGGALQLGSVSYPPLAGKLPGRVMNQYGFQTEGSGFVNIRMHTVVQHSRPSRPIERGKKIIEEKVDYNELDNEDIVEEETELRLELVRRAQKRLARADNERKEREERMMKKGTKPNVFKRNVTGLVDLFAKGNATSPATSPLARVGSRSPADLMAQAMSSIKTPPRKPRSPRPHRSPRAEGSESGHRPERSARAKREPTEARNRAPRATSRRGSAGSNPDKAAEADADGPALPKFGEAPPPPPLAQVGVPPGGDPNAPPEPDSPPQNPPRDADPPPEPDSPAPDGDPNAPPEPDLAPSTPAPVLPPPGGDPNAPPETP